MNNDLDFLDAYIKRTRSYIDFDKFKIYLVVNVKDKNMKYDDYTSTSVTTEYYSSLELNQVVHSIRKTKAQVEVIIGENQFIEKFLNNKIKSDNNTIIINTAQSGTGPGRKSLIPAFCKLNDLKYIGSNAYVVSLCRNKYHVNKILEAHDIPVPKSWLYDYKNGWLNNDIPPYGTEVLVKPIYESASIGITDTSKFIFQSNKLDTIKNISITTNQPVIIQSFISGFEVETPIMRLESKLVGIFPVGISINNKSKLGDKFLTYDDIYFDNYQFYNFAETNKLIADKIIKISKSAFEILGIESFGRIDFRITDNNELFITDVSTSPHLTEHGSYNYMFKSLMYSHEDMFRTLIFNTIY